MVQTHTMRAGAPMTDTASSIRDSKPATRNSPARTHVESDLCCIECEYNLRTLAVTGNCPECNRPVSDSIEANRLENPMDKWLRNVGAGAHHLYWAIAAAFAASLVMVGLIMTGISAIPDVATRLAQDVFGVVVAVTVSIVAGISLLGWILVTSTPPDEARLSRWPHMAARWGLAVAFSVGMFVEVLIPNQHVIATPFIFGVFLSVLGLIVQLRNIAQWANNSALRKRLAFLAWTWVVVALMSLMGAAFADSAMRSRRLWVDILEAASLATLLVFVFATFVLLRQCREAILAARASRELAEAHRDA